MSVRRLAPFIVLFALAACGSEEGLDYDLKTPPPYVGAEPIAPQGQKATDRKMTSGDAERYRPVIAGWAAAVRSGDMTAAASFFDLPAIVFQPGGEALQVNSPQVAAAFNASLPCGARLLGTNPDGRYVVATFVLVDLGRRPCEGEGGLARVGFVFGDERHPRRFTEWWQLDTKPGAEVGPARRPSTVAPATVSDFS